MRRKSLRPWLLVVLAGAATAALVGASRARDGLLLADPALPIEEAWTHRAFGPATEWNRVVVDGMPYIRATGRNGASGLYRDAGYRAREHPWLEWIWRVDRVQPSADIRAVAADDYAAALFVLFDRPSALRAEPRALAYVWTNARVAAGETVASPRHPESMRSIVLESGERKLGDRVRERRNVVDDYRAAFGEEPPEFVEVIALWTDSDQTGEAVEAYYGPIQALAD